MPQPTPTTSRQAATGSLRVVGIASCPVCAGTSGHPCLIKRAEGRDYSLVRCNGCRLVFVAPPPTDEELRRYYDHLWHEGQRPERTPEEVVDQQLREQRFRTRLRELSRLMAPGRILDVGCRDGLFLTLAQEAGWRACGVELVSSAAEQAKRRGLEVRIGNLEEVGWPDGSFDVVTVWHLIEHLKSPLPFLQTIRRVLKPSGLLALETPNVEGRAFRRDREQWEYLVPPQHLCYFGPRSLKVALERAGFRVVWQRVEGGTGVGLQLAKMGLRGTRFWLRQHYRYLKPLKSLYVALFGWIASVDDILVMYARPRHHPNTRLDTMMYSC